MKVSVIIPVYKVENTIEKCLRSVASQNFPGCLECLVVDDASPDTSMERARAFIDNCGARVEWRVLTHERNKGLSEARNTGISAATGDYLYFLDSDDEITPDCIAGLAAMAERHPGVDIVQGNLVVTDVRYRCYDIRQYNFPEFTEDYDWILHHMLTDIPVMACGRLIRRRWLVDNGLTFMPGILHEDEYWRYQAADKVESIAFCSEPSYVYYVTPGSITNAGAKDRSYASMIRVFSDYIPNVAEEWMWRYMLMYLSEARMYPERMNDPAKFESAFLEFVGKAIKHGRMPAWARRAYSYVLKPSALKRMWYAIFHRRTYRLLRRLGEPPF